MSLPKAVINSPSPSGRTVDGLLIDGQRAKDTDEHEVVELHTVAQQSFCEAEKLWKAAASQLD